MTFLGWPFALPFPWASQLSMTRLYATSTFFTLFKILVSFSCLQNNWTKIFRNCRVTLSGTFNSCMTSKQIKDHTTAPVLCIICEFPVLQSSKASQTGRRQYEHMKLISTQLRLASIYWFIIYHNSLLFSPVLHRGVGYGDLERTAGLLAEDDQ